MELYQILLLLAVCFAAAVYIIRHDLAAIFGTADEESKARARANEQMNARLAVDK